MGMIFGDHSLTIPNFPSRLLSYMQAKNSVFVVTDPNTDIDNIITEGYFGWCCESNDSYAFVNRINGIIDLDLQTYGENTFGHLKQNYNVLDSVEGILKHLNLKKNQMKDYKNENIDYY